MGWHAGMYVSFYFPPTHQLTMVFEEQGVKKLSAVFTPAYAICDFSFVLQK